MISAAAVSTVTSPIVRRRSVRQRLISTRSCQPSKMSDPEVSKLIADNLRGIPDFPKPGILFWDVTTLLLDPKVFQATIDAFTKRYKDKKIDVVAGARHDRLQLTGCMRQALRIACGRHNVENTPYRGCFRYTQELLVACDLIQALKRVA